MEYNDKEWFVIPTHPKYLITKNGDVMGAKMKKRLSRKVCDTGYLAVQLQYGKNGIRCYIHDLLADTFFGGRDYTKRVVYKDENYNNTSVENISFVDMDMTPACESLDGEVWLPVVGYEGCYEVSNKGRVRTVERTVLRSASRGVGMPRTYSAQMKPLIKNRTGYYKVNLFKDGKHRQPLVHQLVASAFIANPNGYKFINHLDCNTTNNCVENLEWCTPKMNSQHAVRMGRYNNHIERQLSRLPKLEVTDYSGNVLFVGNTHEIAIKYGYSCSTSITSAIRNNGGKLPRAKIQVRYL